MDPVLGIHYISEAYLAANPDYTGRFTVPALVDIPSGKVVNNDYFNLTLYFETAWKPYHKEGAPDLYPEDLREEIDKLNDIIFREVNNGVYKAGFARKQKAYDRAYNMVFNRLDWLEERLANQRYLFGDRLTESDVRLYVTLVRFDCAYYPVFRLNKSFSAIIRICGHMQEICIRHRDLATQRILRRSRSIIISIAARPMSLRSCQMDRMNPYG